MPIVPADIKTKHSTKSGTAGNSLTSDGASSLGKYISTTEHTGAANDIFDDVSGPENTALDVEYRCVFVHNAHATLALQNAVVWLDSETAGGANLAISVDTNAASAIGSASAQAKEIADEDTAPASQTFTAPTTKATGLALGTLAAGECRAVWIRRTAAASTALASDGGVIKVSGETAA